MFGLRTCAAALAAFLISIVWVTASSAATLTADSLRYDPAESVLFAEGSVRLTTANGVINSSAATGTSDGMSFEFSGGVTAAMETQVGVVNITCDRLEIDRHSGSEVLTAHKDVYATRGNDRLKADKARWTKDLSACKAEGKVDAVFGVHVLKAASAEFSGNEFSAKNVARYEDRSRKMVMSAGSVAGVLKRGALHELTALGGVEVEAPNKSGELLHVTGDKGLFSVARGTIVVTGNAYAYQVGRELRAGSLVYWLDDGRVEAIERPSLILESLE